MSAQSTSPAAPRHADLVEERLVIWFFLAALTYLTISMLAGILMALQFVHWNPLVGIELLSPGRWRMVHTNAIAYGFLANSFLGTLHWAVPRLTFHKVASRWLSYFIFVAWQVVVLSTAVGIIVGPSLQDQPWVADLSKRLGISMCPGGARAGVGRDAVLDRPPCAGGPAAGGCELHAANLAGEGADVRHPVVLHGGVRVDVLDLRHGEPAS